MGSLHTEGKESTEVKASLSYTVSLGKAGLQETLSKTQETRKNINKVVLGAGYTPCYWGSWGRKILPGLQSKFRVSLLGLTRLCLKRKSFFFKKAK